MPEGLLMRGMKLLDETGSERDLELVGLSAITHIGEEFTPNLRTRNSFDRELTNRAPRHRRRGGNQLAIIRRRSAKSRGSKPRSTVMTRIARSMLALTRRITPRAASVGVVRIAPASFRITR